MPPPPLSSSSYGQGNFPRESQGVEVMQEGEVADHGHASPQSGGDAKSGRYIAVDAAEAAIAEAAQGFFRAAGKPFRRADGQRIGEEHRRVFGQGANQLAQHRALERPLARAQLIGGDGGGFVAPEEMLQPVGRSGLTRKIAAQQRRIGVDQMARGSARIGKALMRRDDDLRGAPVALQPIAGPTAHRRPAKTQRPIERRRVAGELIGMRQHVVAALRPEAQSR